MEKDISLIMSLTECNQEIAKNAYEEKNGDVLLAVDFIMFGNNPPPSYKKRKRTDITDHEEYLNSMRKTMENMDSQIEKRQSTTTNPLDCEELSETQDHREEMALQNNCLQECQIPSMEEVAQTRGIECLKSPEYSCDLR